MAKAKANSVTLSLEQLNELVSNAVKSVTGKTATASGTNARKLGKCIVDVFGKNARPVIVLPIKGVYGRPFSFGVAKAKSIVENIDAIRQFAEENATASE